MIPYRLQLPFEQLIKTGPSMERTLLRIYTGDNISETEAKRLWSRIADHKWYVSERLSRDVGFHVAAIDYVEHFYERSANADDERPLLTFVKKLAGKTRSAGRKYFEAKSSALPL